VAPKLADALDVTLDYLLGKSDNMTLDKKNLTDKELNELLEEVPE
jgi:hypothetical protein